LPWSLEGREAFEVQVALVFLSRMTFEAKFAEEWADGFFEIGRSIDFGLGGGNPRASEENEDGEKQATLTTKKDDQSEEKSVVQKTLGLQLSNLTDSLRQRYKIKDQIKGVVITGVDAASVAADKRLTAGSTIVAIEQEQMTAAADVQKKVDALKKAGKKTALLLVATAEGDMLFVALPIE
jgi:membrane-associated protease RseP (regulator of RpoE activity)